MSNLSAQDRFVIAGFAVTIIGLVVAIGSVLFKDIKAHIPNSIPQVAAASTVKISTTTEPTLLPTLISPPVVPLPVLPDIALGTKTYIEVTDGCAAHFQGACLLVRSGPGKNFPVVSKLRTGVVLRAEVATTTGDGTTWYKIIFDEWLRYPERVAGSWYVASDYVMVYHEPVVADYVPGTTPTTTKHISVNRTTQQLAAYDGDTLFMTATTSTGLDHTPTPRGVFTIYKKTPSRYMQGPLPYLDSNQYYDLPGVPWNLYFTEGGAVIHGAYWHTAFGTAYSHGCVNLSLADSHKIYDWATVGTTVTVHD